MACFDSTDASYRLMRSAVKVLADRFTHSETASAAIVEHSLQIILADPDLLSDGSRGALFPVVRRVALEHFGIFNNLPTAPAADHPDGLDKAAAAESSKNKDGNSARR
ncbi:hypothetical protein NT1RE_24745 (plasmid) [Agrobacterium fabrum]|uniref:Uncharacterized protein n=1 Tax=Agrobacterium fabrum (strain C58 / ATCC 33970) TaxID=176299 RepID=Q8UJU9_AGRFC|nr:hypothetical protein [Agrobacterium fabrum]KJX90014.1 hypothetical protein SY94_5417 [Agrobacterium tumefaciens]AAL46064.1 hypothetical protein Atu5376 [Agrobacterium fabrum str. C58]MCX2878266.1 hypothetical protein [Agrobacterium fabrum]NMV72806.1 hypothetical protein [Agrobacterium fabrum]QQN14118.1 hypothetical protein EML540_24740 [Agrobacterium fabrum]